MAHNRYQGPVFGNRGGGRRRSSAVTNDISLFSAENNSGLLHNRSNLSAVDSSRISESNHRNITNESNMSNVSNSTPSIRSNNRHQLHGNHKEHILPLHDPSGKPLRRHGTETFGDLFLHPLKEFQLHQKRMDAYEAEKNEWNEKHPESIASKHDPLNLEEPIM